MSKLSYSQLEQRIKELEAEVKSCPSTYHSAPKATTQSIHSFLFENAIQGIVYQDINGAIIHANNSAEEILGLSIEQMQGKRSIDPSWRSIRVDGSEYPGAEHPSMISLKESRPIIKEVMGVYNPKKQDYTWIRINAIPIFKEGETKAFRVATTFEDITDTKTATDQLIKAKDKAEESDRLKSAFLANMSHEIRTPLNAILGFSDLLVRGKISEEKQIEFLNFIHTGGKQLLTIITDIIDISKIEVNQLKINIRPVDINLIIDDLDLQFSLNISNSVKLSSIKDSASGKLLIKTDANRLKQIISNLLENAKKFTKEGTIEFGYTLKDTELEFYVKDTGIGIDPKSYEVVFERFGQAESEHSHSGYGTGLGLSIAKGLVELLGGKIWVESAIGEGASFYFTIPLVRGQEIDDKLENAFKSKQKKATILIAEDEELNFIYINELFKAYKYNIVRARNGLEAVEIFKSNNSIDVILMDIKMPKKDGFAAMSEIREINDSIPIIALTALAMANDKTKILDEGFTDYLAKPISEKELDTILHKYIE